MAICFLLMICFIWMPFFTSAALLAPPQNITILSTNMKHFLVWSPVAEIAPGEVVKYSVEFQGEYERDYANDSWIPIAECTDVSITQCDITEDISATVPYNLRVRASMGTEASLWATLNGFFNRVTTSLIPPMLTVTTDGYHLLAELEHLGPAFDFWIFYWKKGPEPAVYRKVVRESTTTVHLKTMEAGAEYCVKAQTYVEAINRSSNFSEVQCEIRRTFTFTTRASQQTVTQLLPEDLYNNPANPVTDFVICVTQNFLSEAFQTNSQWIEILDWINLSGKGLLIIHVQEISAEETYSDAKAMLLTFAPLFLVTFFVAVLVLPFLAWKTCRICQYSFCPDEVLPDTLKLTASPAKILKDRGEDMEKCDESVQVLPSEEVLLHFWIHETL